jgi:hypothetical protein
MIYLSPAPDCYLISKVSCNISLFREGKQNLLLTILAVTQMVPFAVPPVLLRCQTCPALILTHKGKVQLNEFPENLAYPLPLCYPGVLHADFDREAPRA